MQTDKPSIDEIFLAAVELPLAERASYLDDVCEDDSQLRARVDQLLGAQSKVDSFLGSPAPELGATIDQPMAEKPGTQIGPYKLLQEVGEGGMGIVYMAEQKEPVKRRVALKIIKPGMDSRQVIARFEAERQALAMMDHPNIAKVLDAGQTGSGRPYFVMELVKGVPITQYCDEQHLTPKERLQLFVPICQAIQHAHQKGIIHRDIKPSNVLVALFDGRAVPKVIDFGVAKATTQTLTEKTIFTQLGQVVGTLEYMSPEQAQVNQLDVDTRSDIYSLGVLLYELLTGDTPFDRARLRSAAFDEMLRIIREEEPSKPSTKVSGSQSLPSVAANRRMEPARLGSTIRGELDWIVMKALEKDRSRRYETASKFAEDVQHYLDDEAVVACPPSTAYRFRKFARRNKAALATAALVTLALVIGVIGTSWQAIRASRAATLADSQRQRAEQQEQRAEDNFQSAMTAVDRMLTHVGDEQLKDVPQAELVRTQILEEAVELYQRFLDEKGDDPGVRAETARARQRVGILYYELHRGEDAEAALTQSIRMLTDLVKSDESLRADLARSQHWLGKAKQQLGKPADAKQAYQRAIDDWRRVLAKSSNTEARRYLAWGQNNLGLVLKATNHVEEAGNSFQQAIEARRTLADEFPDQPIHRSDLAGSYNNLAQVMMNTRRFEEAESLFRQAVKIQERLVEQFELVPQYREYLSNHCGQMRELLGARLKRPQDALAWQRRAVEYREQLVADYPHVLRHRSNLAEQYALLAWVLRNNDQLDESERYAARCIELADRLPKSETLQTSRPYATLARMRRSAGQLEEAVSLFERAIDGDAAILDTVPGRRTPLALNSERLARTLWTLGRYDEADSWFDRAIAERLVLAEQASDNSQLWLKVAELCRTAADLNDAQDRHTQAIRLFRESCSHFEAVPASHRNAAHWGHLGRALYRTGRYDEARDALKAVIKLRKDSGPKLQHGPRWWYLAMSLHQLGETERARAHYEALAGQMRIAKTVSKDQKRLYREATKLLGVDADPREGNAATESHAPDEPAAKRSRDRPD